MSDTPPTEVVVTAPAPTQVASAAGVPTFQPKVLVTLKKTIQRKTVGSDIAAAQRFTGANQTIDLTPYLGEGSAVTVSKSVRDGSGMFAISITDQMIPDLLDSAYGLVEPMDVIEIRMARDPSLYAGKYPTTPSMPILMRGFVGDVRRVQTMTPSGPQRSVTISGQDYGKILQIVKPIYLLGVDPTADLITTFGLFDNYGVSADFVSPADFINEVMTKIVNQGGVKTGFIAALQGQSTSSPIQFIATDLQASDDRVSPIGTNGWRGGSILDMFKAFCDVGPWFELYVEDRDAAPYLVYRPTPFKDLQGNLIQSMDTPPKRVLVPSANIVSLEVGRSDQNVANYFNVSAGRYQLYDKSWMQAAALNSDATSPYVSDYPNCDPTLYGVRPMEADTEMGRSPIGLKQADLDAATQGGLNNVTNRRATLIANNRDNAVLESGSATVRGDETLKAGVYVRFQLGQGKILADAYCPAVTHQFVVMRSYTTMLTLERGTGFVDRLQNSSSPYLAELGVKGAYQ